MYSKARYLFASVTALLALGVSCPAATKTDASATLLTQIFYDNLQSLTTSPYTAFGQQYSTWRGINAGGGSTWVDDFDRSDIKSVTGYHPGVSGWNFGTYLGLSAADKALFVQRIKDDYNRNIIITIHWPMNNLITDGNDNDITGMYDSPSILQRAVTSGDSCNNILNANFDAFATFLGLLTDADGKRIPLVFRPWHEMNGKGHWWGTEGNGQQTEYKALWNYTLTYLRNTKAIHQLIYCYAPGGGKTGFNEAEYLKNWPGDTSVDICGVDQYLTDATVAAWDTKMDVVYQFATARGMPAAFTELGPKDGLVVSPGGGTWWTSRVLASFNSWNKCAYMMTWTNQNSGSFFVSYPGHAQSGDLVTFVNHPNILLQPDLPPMYGTKVTFTANGAHDGWVRESGENTNVGGNSDAVDASSSALRAGDNSNNRQYKSVLSFDTISLPDDAIILSATLKLKRGTVVGTNPFTWAGNTCYVDIKKGTLGLSLSLENGDFEATNISAAQVATLSNALANGDWSNGALNATGRNEINLSGYTQFRVYFTIDDQGAGVNDYIGWYSGNDATTANHPQLEIIYKR